jgi:hypothetical protein
VVIIKIPNTFTNEGHTDMHFMYNFYNGNGRAAVVEYQQRYPLCRIPHCKTFENVRTALRETTSFPQVNAEREQRQHGEDSVLAAVQ